jgi:hypothetical protein
LLAITAGRDRGIVDELPSRHASPEHLIDLRNHPIREPHNTLRTRDVAITARTRGSAHGTLAGHQLLRGGPGMMVGDESIRMSAQWMVDPECPWWAELRRAESLIDEIRNALRRSTEQGVARRSFGRR